MVKKAKCLADGGVIGGDGLTDAQRAKLNGARASLGVSNAPPAALQQPVPVPQAQPLPQQQGITSGIVGILKGRQQQIDKAAGYAEGGIVRGKGGVDNVPMEISGTKVNLTGGKLPEAVLPGKTVQALGGPAAVESLIEATNGKPPVRDGLKAGGNYLFGVIDDFEDAANRDTPLAAIIKPFRTPQKKMPDVPVEDQRAYASQRQTAAASPSSISAQTGIPSQGIAAVPAPSVPSLGSGLYGMSRTIASSGVAPNQAVGQGRDANGVITADSAAAAAGNPMTRSGGIAGGIDMAGANGVLARENKARGEMIDSMVKANGGNGVSISQSEETLPGGISVRDWNDRVSSGFNTGMTPIQKAAYLAQEGGQNIQARGQDLASQQAMVRDTITARGQDLQNERAAAHDKVTMRGQDISGANDAIRAGIDQKRLGIVEADSKRAADKWGIERGILQGQAADSELQRNARTAMNSALATGDAEAYKKARQQGIAAGLKFDEDKTQKPMEIADPNDRSGLKKILVQPNSDGTYTQMQAAAQQKSGAPSFASVADVNAAKAAGKIKSGDVIQTPNGLMTVR